MNTDANALRAQRGCAADEQSQVDLLIGHKPVVLGLLLLGQAIVFWSDTQSNQAHRLMVIYFALTIFLLVGIAWWLDGMAPARARWFTVLISVLLVYLGNYWLRIPGFLVLAVLPVILAAALIGRRAALIVGGLETVLLLALPHTIITGGNVGTVLVALAATWLTCLLVWIVYSRLHEVVDWSYRYARQASVLMEEDEDRKLALAQALDDLSHANVQLTRLNSRAQALRQLAEDARTAKAEFVANVSHELRTPINMITGFTQLILASPQAYGSRIPPSLLADLSVVQRNAAHLAELIDDVLDLSQVDADRVALTKELLRIDKLVSEAATAVMPLFESKGLYLKTDVPHDLPPVLCDRTRIRQVLLNLLSNAGRFTERGGVRLRAHVEGGDLCVAITDTGPGIAPDALQKVFQPFEQADGSIRRRYGGTGLGLNISRKFIELHEGKIWAESELDAGTTVSFRIPVTPQNPIGGGFLRGIVPGWEYLQRTRPSAAPRAAVPRRFVVLEPGASLRRLLDRYWNGAEIVSACVADEAIALARSVPTQAILVNDISVGEALRRFSASGMLPESTPVIMLSLPGADELSSSPTATMRLVKPVDQDLLLDALARLGVAEGVVLIVDDEPDALQLFSRMLVAPGRSYRVLLARDGAEALDVMRQCRPDAILLDLVMPNLDGFQVLELRAQDPDLSSIPVVILSAQDPSRQPIVSHAVAATQSGGLSLPQLLACVDALSLILGVPTRAAVPEPASTPAG